jgi:hypothetical protein
MSKPAARDRLAQAAFALFDERGYDQTTVDDITERAGLGRTTFFPGITAPRETSSSLTTTGSSSRSRIAC